MSDAPPADDRRRPGESSAAWLARVAPRRRDGDWRRLVEWARDHRLDPWELVASGSVNHLEICVWVSELDQASDPGRVGGPVVPTGLYRVNPGDLRRLAVARSAIQILRLEETSAIADESPWMLAAPLDVVLDVLVVRTSEWEGFFQGGGSAGPPRDRNKRVELRRDAVFGVLVELLVEASKGKYSQGPDLRPNVAAIAGAVVDRIGDASGNVPSGFATRTVTEHIKLALQAASELGESGGRR